MTTAFTVASIRAKLDNELSPDTLEVVNESAQHAGHIGRAGKSEDDITHIKITVTAAVFAGLSRPAIHRRIYGILREELENGLHAVAIDASAP